MSNKKLVCRVCGKHYEGCKSAIGVANKWTDIACSTECYKEYIERIRESRNIDSVTDTIHIHHASNEDIYDEVDIIDDYEDEDEEDDEEDEESLDLFGE